MIKLSFAKEADKELPIEQVNDIEIEIEPDEAYDTLKKETDKKDA